MGLRPLRTISHGERIIAPDPPAGILDPAEYPNLNRFRVTFDSPNYVYIDDITVETPGADPPQVIQTWRRETDGPETVEIVLDRPIAPGQPTRFIFDDGEVINYVEYNIVRGIAGPIPTVTEWGLIVLAVLLVAVGTLVFTKRRPLSTA